MSTSSDYLKQLTLHCEKYADLSVEQWTVCNCELEPDEEDHGSRCFGGAIQENMDLHYIIDDNGKIIGCHARMGADNGIVIWLDTYLNKVRGYRGADDVTLPITPDTAAGINAYLANRITILLLASPTWEMQVIE